MHSQRERHPRAMGDNDTSDRLSMAYKRLYRKLRLKFPRFRRPVVELTLQCYDRRPTNIAMFVTSWDVS